MKSEIEVLYKCGECREVHEDEDDAQECCRPAIIEVYQCPECESICDEIEEAESCCGSSDLIQCHNCQRDHGKSSINGASVEVTGHCSFCNPLYSPEEAASINAHHLEKTERIGCIEEGIS